MEGFRLGLHCIAAMLLTLVLAMMARELYTGELPVSLENVGTLLGFAVLQTANVFELAVLDAECQELRQQ